MKIIPMCFGLISFKLNILAWAGQKKCGDSAIFCSIFAASVASSSLIEVSDLYSIFFSRED